MGRGAILATSFGTTYNDSRAATIDAIERDLASAFPGFEVRRAFTSRMVASRIEKRDGTRIDSPEDALLKLLAEGFTEVAMVPTMLMAGHEYEKAAAAFEALHGRFARAAIARPLLSADADYVALARAVIELARPYRTPGTAVVFMGHGSDSAANASYATLQRCIDDLYDDAASPIFIGTVEGTPTLQDMLDRTKENGASRVVLENLMVVAGDHANNDLAGNDEGSWKSVFEHAGYETQAIVKGLGEYPVIRALYVEHAREAIEALGERA